MSPIDRDRARARRRYDRREIARQEKAQQQRRNRQVAVVVAAMLVVVGAFVALSGALRGGAATARAGGSTPRSTPGTSPSPSVSDGSRPAASCTPPPPAPSAAPKASLPPKTLAAGRTWTARIVTTCGTITVDLDGAKAPQTVSSFIALARSGFWAKSPCHRLTTSGIYVLQCGDPTGTGQGGPGYGFGIENAPRDGSYPRGTLAMARTSDPNSNGSQFFLVYKPTQLPTDGGGYSIFGTVTGGMSVVDTIAAKGVAGGGGDGAPASPVSILSVAIAEKKA